MKAIPVVLLTSMSAVAHGFGMSLSMSSKTPPPFDSTSYDIKRSSVEQQQRYAVNLKFSIKPERRKDFLDLIRDNQRKTLELEPAALQYVVGEDVDTPNTFYLHEEFIGSEGFDAHRDMPHAADWATFKSSNPFVQGGEPTLDFYFDYESGSSNLGNENDENAMFTQIPIRQAFCVHVELCVKPEFRQEFISVIQNNQKGTLGMEPLCLQYVFGESTSAEHKFVFHEEYKGNEDGKEGFDAHTKTPHFQTWEEFVDKDPFTKPPVVNLFRTI